MAFHGCLCDECDCLYGYIGTLPSGKQVVYGKCEYGQDSIRFIERVLEAQRRLRDRGEELTSKSISDELSAMYYEREQEAKERAERAELNRLERKYRRKRGKS